MSVQDSIEGATVVPGTTLHRITGTNSFVPRCASTILFTFFAFTSMEVTTFHRNKKLPVPWKSNLVPWEFMEASNVCRWEWKLPLFSINIYLYSHGRFHVRGGGRQVGCLGAGRLVGLAAARVEGHTNFCTLWEEAGWPMGSTRQTKYTWFVHSVWTTLSSRLAIPTA